MEQHAITAHKTFLNVKLCEVKTAAPSVLEEAEPQVLPSCSYQAAQVL